MSSASDASDAAAGIPPGASRSARSEVALDLLDSPARLEQSRRRLA